MSRLSALAADQAGFTLMELLVAIVILGVIMGPVAAAVIAVVHNTAATQQRLTESHDAQITAAYFANDVQSAAVTGTVLPSSGQYDSSCQVAGYTSLVQFQWTEYDVTGNVTAFNLATYETQPSTGSGVQPALHRVNCRGPAQGSTTQSSDVIVAHILSSSVVPGVCVFTCANQQAKAVGMTVTEQDGFTFFVSGVGRSTG